ncbi:MAG TPA: ABC transporter substrate-binding protein [Victivallales bacterium]|nr:ABC transporter substrate-binding protein [Victivallales bacterium]
MKKNIPLKIGILLTILIFCSFDILNGQEPVASQPKKIISLSPPSTEQIFLLGAGDALVACTTYCTRPDEAQKKEKIGSLREINVEKIVSLSPDLVIASSITKPALVEKLNSFGIKTVVFKSPQDFKTLFKQFVELGELLGTKDKAAKIASASEEKIIRISSLTSKFQPKPKILFQVGAKPMYLSGNDSFVGDFINCAGGLNLLADRPSGVYSREMIVAENPDVIILTAMGFATEAEEKDWMRFNSISAVKKKSIFTLESSEICSPNPVQLPETVAKIAKLLFPEHAKTIDESIAEKSQFNPSDKKNCSDKEKK